MRVVITGASRGIGLALAEHYRAAGAEVIGTSTAGGGGLLPLDVTDPAAFAGLSGAVGGAPVDLLICNAGIFEDRGQPLDGGYDPAVWAREFAVNVTGVFLTVQTLLPSLRASMGRVAIISSRMGSSRLAAGGSYVYRASKAAALNLGRNLAVDLKGDGISVGIYHPGHVRTDMGGAGAPVDVTDSAKGLAARFDELTPDTTGTFLAYDGEALPF